MSSEKQIRSTTILCVRIGDKTVIAGDGQVSIGETVMKKGAKKVRRLYNDKVVVGFAGATADAFTLYERLEGKLEKYNGNLKRAVVELAKDWRLDRALRRLDALMIVADEEASYLVSGTGDVIEPDDGILAIGSGGPYALAAARALMNNSKLSANQIATEAMKIAAGICIYTNDELTVEEM